MKKTVLLVAGLLSLLCSHGEVELVWQKDLSPDLGAYTHYYESGTGFMPSQFRQFPNDDIAIIFSNSGGSSSAVVVLDKNGDILINETFSTDFGASFVGRSTREQFAVDFSVGAQKTLRVFEYDGSTTTATNISYNTAYSLSQFEGTVSQHFYKLDGTVLSKFRITSNPVNLLGDVYAGIDGSNFRLTWNSIAGAHYQIQSTINLTNWTDVGSTIVGTGDPISWANALTNSSSFYRVIEK